MKHVLIQRLIILYRNLVCEDESASIEELSECILYYYVSNNNNTSNAKNSNKSNKDNNNIQDAIQFMGYCFALENIVSSFQKTSNNDNGIEYVTLTNSNLIFIPLEYDIDDDTSSSSSSILAVCQIFHKSGGGHYVNATTTHNPTLSSCNVCSKRNNMKSSSSSNSTFNIKNGTNGKHKKITSPKEKRKKNSIGNKFRASSSSSISNTETTSSYGANPIIINEAINKSYTLYKLLNGGNILHQLYNKQCHSKKINNTAKLPHDIQYLKDLRKELRKSFINNSRYYILQSDILEEQLQKNLDELELDDSQKHQEDIEKNNDKLNELKVKINYTEELIRELQDKIHTIEYDDKFALIKVKNTLKVWFDAFIKQLSGEDGSINSISRNLNELLPSFYLQQPQQNSINNNLDIPSNLNFYKLIDEFNNHFCNKDIRNHNMVLSYNVFINNHLLFEITSPSNNDDDDSIDFTREEICLLYHYLSTKRSKYVDNNNHGNVLVDDTTTKINNSSSSTNTAISTNASTTATKDTSNNTTTSLHGLVRKLSSSMLLSPKNIKDTITATTTTTSNNRIDNDELDNNYEQQQQKQNNNNININAMYYLPPNNNNESSISSNILGNIWIPRIYITPTCWIEKQEQSQHNHDWHYCNNNKKLSLRVTVLEFPKLGFFIHVIFKR